MAGREPVFWHTLGITSGILSTGRWGKAGFRISKRFLIRLVIYFCYKECCTHTYMHRVTTLARSKPCHSTN